MSLPQSAFINFDLIQQKTIREYILERKLKGFADFEKLTSTCYKSAEKDTYLTHTKKFEVHADLETVWNTYLNIPPRDTWKCDMVSFGCMYCSNSRELTYMHDEYKGLLEGQVLFLNIRLLWGLINIAVAHKIIRVNEKEKYIEFSYIEGGKTEGSQRLIFQAEGEDTTLIVHRTTYRGKTSSDIREKLLYPFLHGRVISSFHRNVKQKVMAVLSGKK